MPGPAPGIIVFARVRS